jgi:hypothetical protein
MRRQDTEDFDFIQYSVVIKLTADAAGEPPSRMRVVGGARHFEYGAQAGAAGLFKARLHHASVPPASEAEHIKVAFFFRKPAANGVDEGAPPAARPRAAAAISPLRHLPLHTRAPRCCRRPPDCDMPDSE